MSTCAPMPPATRRALPWALGVGLLLGCTASREALGIHPESNRHTALCAAALVRDELRTAEAHCEHALDFSPHNPDAWSNYGLVALREGAKDKARDRFIRALRLNPEHAQSYNNLGVLDLREGETARARTRFERALTVNPDYVEARRNLAIAYLTDKRLDEAAKQLQRIVVLQPDLAWAHQELGSVELELGHVESAIRSLRTAVRLNTLHADAWLALGAAYGRQGRFAEARDAFLACLDADAEAEPCRTSLRGLSP